MKKILSIMAISLLVISMSAGMGFTASGGDCGNGSGGSTGGINGPGGGNTCGGNDGPTGPTGPTIPIGGGGTTGWGLAGVINGQGQLQNSGGFAGSNGQTSGFIGGYGGAQTQFGTGGALFGNASDWQTQGQGSFDGIGNQGSGAYWDTIQIQNGGGNTGRFGAYGYSGSQAMIGGAAGFSHDGRIGVAGSGFAGFQESQAGEVGRKSSAYQNNYQAFSGGYSIKSVGANGFVYQTGSQDVQMRSSANTEYGPSESSNYVLQGGGTITLNDGQAKAMVGGGAAGAVGVSNGDAGFGARQTHSYEQKSVDGGNWQYQAGSVSTRIGTRQDQSER